MPAAWSPLLRLAAAHFAIPPEAFWRLSLVEWRALTESAAEPPPLDRDSLNALLAAFPDDPA